VTDESGRRFRIGTGFSNKERRNPPAVGTVITYKFTGTTKKGLPKFASFLRIYQQF
jgi:DNA ligase-1